MNAPNDTPLAEWLRKATPEQRERLATLTGTSVNYCYQVASCRREPKVGLALRIEDGTRLLHEETMGVLPVVTARQLAEAWALAGINA